MAEFYFISYYLMPYLQAIVNLCINSLWVHNFKDLNLMVDWILVIGISGVSQIEKKDFKFK